MVLHEQTTKMEGEPTAKNVQKGARFKIQRENEARMLVRLAPPERGKMRASVIIYFAVSKLFQIRGTHREYSSKPLKHSIVKRI